jgi:hypothetical protein
LTSNIHSSHDLNGPEAKRFRVKLSDLKIPKIDRVKLSLGLLEAEDLKSKDLANEHPAFMPADVAAVVDSWLGCEFPREWAFFIFPEQIGAFRH